MLSEGRVYLRSASWVTTFPGLAIMVTVMAINLLGDGLRDVLDPRLRL
jgi:peptide/nickel transport system permease protein